MSDLRIDWLKRKVCLSMSNESEPMYYELFDALMTECRSRLLEYLNQKQGNETLMFVLDSFQKEEKVYNSYILPTS